MLKVDDMIVDVLIDVVVDFLQLRWGFGEVRMDRFVCLSSNTQL